jgi:DNA-binding transcriptional LysR family regulator
VPVAGDGTFHAPESPIAPTRELIDSIYQSHTTSPLELRHLRYFIAVAELLHFGRAARRLQVTQPSLSHQIRQLEDELRVRLLERTRRHVELTAAGRLFLNEAREITAKADHAALIARRAGRRDAPALRVGIGLCTDQAFAARVIAVFNERRPKARVEVQTLAVTAQLDSIRDSRLDVGLVRAAAVPPPLAAEALLREPLVVALPARHRVAHRSRISLSALAAETFVLVPREVVPVYHGIVLEACRGAGFVPDAPHEADHLQMMLQLVARGVGIALVPMSAPKTRGVVFRQLRAPVPMLETAIAWRLDSAPVVDAFVAIARALAHHAAGGGAGAIA